MKWLSIPNILADEPLFPEFVQAEATAENLSRAALELLNHAARRAELMASLRSPSAPERAARHIVDLPAGPGR